MAARRAYSVYPFPELTGPHGVGCSDFLLYTGKSDQALLVRIYYPSAQRPESVPKASLVRWLPHRKYVKAMLTSVMGMSSVLATPIAPLLSAATTFYVPAVHKAPLLDAKDSKAALPIVVFSHGLSAMRTIYSMVHCDLASHGYIVAAVEHKDGSASLTYTMTKGTDGAGNTVNEERWLDYVSRPKTELPLRYEQVKQRSEEMSEALDFLHLLNSGNEINNLLPGNFDSSQFRQRCDFDHVVAMGHSFGGATAIVSLALDKRFHCGVCLDTWMFPVYEEIYQQVDRPTVFINTWHFHWPDNIVRMQKLIGKIKESGCDCQMFTIRGSVHTSQTDMHFLSPNFFLKLLKYSCESDPYEAFDASLKLSYAFMERRLWKGESPQLILDDRELEHELVMEGTNVDIVTEPKNGNDNGVLPADSTTAKPTTPNGCVTDVLMPDGADRRTDPPQETTLNEPVPEYAMPNTPATEGALLEELSVNS